MSGNTLDLEMTGTVTAESDISVSPPDHSRKEGRSTVMTLPRKSVWRRGHLVTTVYLPGSSLRGALRNTASRAVAAARATGTSRMTPDAFLLLAKGGIKDRKEAGTDERVVNYAAMETLRREQPIVSLFGAMAEKIAGRWQIGDAVPREPLERPNHKGRGVRSHPFQRQPDLAAFMNKAEYESFLEKDAKRVEANVAERKAKGLEEKMFAERRKDEPDTENIEQWEKEKKSTGGEREEPKRRSGRYREHPTIARRVGGHPGRHRNGSPNAHPRSERNRTRLGVLRLAPACTGRTDRRPRVRGGGVFPRRIYAPSGR